MNLRRVTDREAKALREDSGLASSGGSYLVARASRRDEEGWPVVTGGHRTMKHGGRKHCRSCSRLVPEGIEVVEFLIWSENGNSALAVIHLEPCDP